MTTSIVRAPDTRKTPRLAASAFSILNMAGCKKIAGFWLSSGCRLGVRGLECQEIECGWPNLIFGRRPMKANHSGSERRASPRFACTLETSCRLLGPRKDHTQARVLDVSTGGVALWLNRWYDSGTFLAVDLPGEKGDPDVHPSVVKIQYAVPQGGNWWMVGAAFARNRRQEEIKALL